MGEALRIAVVGAGVIGLAIARELAISGADVTVFDKSGVGAGTSSTTFAWINSNGKRPDSYHQLNLAGMAEHRRLQAVSGAEWFVPSGTYEWATSSAREKALSVRADLLRAHGYRVHALPHPAVARELPQLREVPDFPWWAFPDWRYVYPKALLSFLLTDAQAHAAPLSAPVAFL